MQKDDVIYRQGAIEAVACAIWHYPNLSFLSDYDHAHELAEDALKRLPSAEQEIHPITYQDCKNALLKMWMENCLTDDEYDEIANKLLEKYPFE